MKNINIFMKFNLILSSLLLSAILCSKANSDTIVLPVDDILFEIPDFEPPKMNLGGFKEKNIEEKKKTRKNDIRNDIVRIARIEYPNARKIEIIRGKLVILK